MKELDADPVRIHRGRFVLPMNALLPPDPNPPLPSCGHRSIYPYSLQHRFEHEPVARELTELTLENAYLRLQVLPELGGRLWQAVNRLTGHALFHTPRKVGLVNFGLRGAWFTGGIEFNFPNGHTVTTLETVPALTRHLPDGGASVIVGNLDLAWRVGWSVGIRLQPDSSNIYLDALAYNRTSLPVRYWWWLNAGVPGDESLEYVNATTEVLAHLVGRRASTFDLLGWPIHQGNDLSRYAEVPEPSSLFHLAGDPRVFGFYIRRLDEGVVRIGSSGDTPGLKFWISGKSEEGFLWGKHMTCGERYSNTEVQSGRPETQTDFGVLPPHYTLRWTEMWRPVWGLGGVTCASEAVTIHLAPAANGSILRLLADRPRPGCTVRAIADDERVVSCDLPADRPLELAVPFPADVEPLTIEVIAPNSQVLLTYNRPLDRERRSVLADVLQYRPDLGKRPDEMAVEELSLEVGRFERWNLPDPARRLAEQALKLDPGHIATHQLLAARDLREGRYEAAREHCETILWRNPRHEWAHFMLALSHLWAGDERQAEIEFERAAGQGYAVSAAAWFHVGQLRLVQRDWQAALTAFAKCLAHEANHVKALALRAAALRHAGRLAEVQQALRQVTDLAPLDPLVRAENWLIASCPESSSPWTGFPPPTETETYVDLRTLAGPLHDALEATCDYVACGLIDDARQVLGAALALARAGESANGPVPLALYYLGCLDLWAEDEASALARWEAAAQHSGGYTFSFRREDANVLSIVLAHRPQDGLAHALVGMLETYRNNPERALPHLATAIELRPGWDQPYRLSAICYRLVGQPDQAIECLRRAIETNPANARLYIELDNLLAGLPGQAARREKLWSDAPASILEDDRALCSCAAALIEAGQCESALELLGKRALFPEEASDKGRALYAQAQLALALDALDAGQLDAALRHAQLAASYPENLGLGAPLVRCDAPAHVLEAIIRQRQGDQQAAHSAFERAAGERHRETTEAEFFAGLALRALGRKSEARAKFHALVAKAEYDLAWPDQDAQFARFIRALGQAGLNGAPLPPSHAKEQFPLYRQEIGICARIARCLPGPSAPGRSRGRRG